MNIGHEEPFGLMARGAEACPIARSTRSSPRRARARDLEERSDILSLIMRAETEDGEELTDGSCATS